MVDAGDDFSFFGIGVGGDGETWACRGVGRFGGWCTGRSSDDWFGMGRIGRDRGWVHKHNGGVTELRLGGDNFDAITEDGDTGGRHVVVVWRCW